MTIVRGAADVARCHPCFNEEAHERVGRVHLPIARRCNIQCAFCERRTCANLGQHHPGWTERVLTVDEAVAHVGRLVEVHRHEAFVVGVAGPGDPLANEETFEALNQVHRAWPNLTTCISSNGLLLADTLPRLLDAGIRALTVTVNAPDPEVGSQIYLWVRYDGVIHQGEEGAALLIERQFLGIRAALDAGLAVKVNTVLIPGVNDAHVERLAGRLREAGVTLMNIMPLIPSGAMRNRRAPTCDELSEARTRCETILPQFRLCKQCRADIVWFPDAVGV